MRELSDSAAAAAEVLEGIGARWALIGALAALEYRSTPRLTTDVDILAEATNGMEQAFVGAGYDVTGIADEGERPHLLVVRGKGDRIDVLIAEVDYQLVALDRAIDHLITAEDVIVHKLIAWRPRDRDDVVSILETGRRLDEEYIERWAAQWEVTDRWEAARRSR